MCPAEYNLHPYRCHGHVDLGHLAADDLLQHLMTNSFTMGMLTDMVYGSLQSHHILHDATKS